VARGCDRGLDQAAVADVFRRDLDAGLGRAPHQIGNDGARREPPVGGSYPIVDTAEGLELLGVEVLGGVAQLPAGVLRFGLICHRVILAEAALSRA
jgi:hypothetical protein